VDQSAAYGMVFFDPDRKIRHWNSGAEKLFGYTSAEMIGRDGALIFAPEDVRAGVPQQEVEIATATGAAEDRRWKVRKDGSRFFADGIMVALHGEHGEIVGFAKIIRDATA